MNVIRVSLADGAQRVVWAIPRGQIVTRRNGPRWDLDAETTDPASLQWRWDDAVDSLRRWLAAYKPPIVYEHDYRDRAPGEPVPARGHVVGLFTMDADDAAESGIDLRGAPEALFFVLEPDDVTAALLDSGSLPYTSPMLEANYEDDAGEVWPLVLTHHSFVRNPRQKTRQVPTTELRDSPPRLGAAACLSEFDPPCDTGVTMQDKEETAPMEDGAGGGDALMELAEMVRTLAERLDRIETAMAETPEDEPAAMSDDTPADTETAKLRAEVDALKGELVRRDASEQVRAIMSERDVPADAADLLTDLRVESPKRFDAIVALLPRRSTPKTRPATSPSVAALGDDDLRAMPTGVLANRLQAQGRAAGEDHPFSHYVTQARSLQGA
jgi:hypothetical protein